MAGPLTQFFNGVDVDPLAIWNDVFENDWDVALAMLPKAYLKPENFQHIQSREMYKRCKQYFKYVQSPNIWEYYYENPDVVDDNEYGREFNIIASTYLLVAPMKNMWLDQLCDVLRFPMVLARMAVARGTLPLLQYLIDDLYDDIDRSLLAIDYAADNGHLHIVKFLHENGCRECSTDAVDLAAGHGYIDIIKWLHQNRTEGCTSEALEEALSNDHLNIVEYLETHYNVGFSKYAMANAARKGNFDAIKFLNEQRNVESTPSAMDEAAQHGHLDIVKYLHENRSEGCTTSTMNYAALKGHFDI
ncbi:hypothetical protein THRCLA_22758, partial [Thraustotheca clavata]